MRRAKEGSAAKGDAPQLTKDDSTAPPPAAVEPPATYRNPVLAGNRGPAVTATDRERRPEAIDELEAVARQILAPDFDGDTREALLAALEQMVTSRGDRLAHFFMDLWLDAEAHDCLSNSRGCYLCQIIRAQREGRRQ